MEVLTFEYEGSNGFQERTLVVQVSPGTMYAGTDISELDPESQAEYIVALKELHAKYVEDLIVLNNTYDLAHRYRMFKPGKMIGVRTEKI